MAGKRRKKTNKKRKQGISIKNRISSFGGVVFKNIGWLLLIVILTGGVFLFTEYCHTHDTFVVKNIEINKTQFISRENILNIARIHNGVNIFNVDLSESAHRLELLPRIKRAEIKRLLPYTISINITERREVAQVKLPFRSKYYLIDNEGCVLVPVLKEPREGLIIIDARFSRQSYLSPGDYFFNRQIQIALRLVTRLKYNPVLKDENVLSIVIDHSDNMTLVLNDKLEIKFSKDIDDALTKLDKVKHILSDPMSNSVKYIDLRFKNIVVKKK